MQNHCNKCGKCCEAIFLQHTKKEVKGYKNNADAAFILKNWERISKKEALEINPHLAEWETKRHFFYRCAKFDKNTRLCSVHEDRPRVCSRYPFYGRDKLPFSEPFYSESCGYNREELKELQK